MSSTGSQNRPSNAVISGRRAASGFWATVNRRVDSHFSSEVGSPAGSKLLMLVIVSAAGYFVDAYDLIIFSAVRSQSLADLGVAPSLSLSVGLSLLNYQMVGLLLGGILFGMIGDKRGRLAVLFGSICLYSVSNVLNGFIQDIGQYKILRFLSGIGLAGELGAGITVVSEVMAISRRAIGTVTVGTFGFLGAAAAGLVGNLIPWRASFIIGGIMGLVLLFMRIGLVESSIYQRIRHKQVSKGNFFWLFSNRERFFRYLRCIGVGLPTYFIVGLLVTGAPEFGKTLGVEPLPLAGTALFICYLAMSGGNIACGFVSQWLKSRRRAIMLFNAIVLVGVVWFTYLPPASPLGFYVRCALLGFGCGFWALVATNAAEQFGTNLRATVAITVPNFIRGALVPIAFLFNWLKPHIGIVNGAAAIGIMTALLAMAAAFLSEETFAKDLEKADLEK